MRAQGHIETGDAEIAFIERAMTKIVLQHAHQFEGVEIDDVALRIAIIGECLEGGEEQGQVLEPVDDIVGDRGPVVSRIDEESDRGAILAAAAIRHKIVERRGAIIVLAGRESDLAIRRPGDLAMFRVEIEPVDRQRVIVWIGVVGEQRGRVDNQNLIFERLEAAVVHGVRRVVQRNDIDLDRSGRRRALVIDDRVGEARFPR